MVGFMRKAAWALAPVLALASTDQPIETTPSALVNLNIPSDLSDTQSLTLRLDLLESNQPCSPANLQLNGQLLSQDPQGQGHGALPYSSGGVLNATWSFTCNDEDDDPSSISIPQTLHMTLWGLDDELLSHKVSFSARFRQTAPVVIASIEGGDVETSVLVVPDQDSQQGEEGSDLKQDGVDNADASGDWDSGVQKQMQEIEDLRKQISELHQLIFNKEAALMERLGKPMPNRHKHHTPVAECDTLRCVVRSLSSEFTHIIGFHGRPHHGHPPPPRPAFHDGPEALGPDFKSQECQCPPPPPPHGEHEHLEVDKHPHGHEAEQPMTPHNPDHKSEKPHGAPNHRRPNHHGPPPPLFLRPAFLAVFGGLVAIMGVFAIYGLRVLHTHVTAATNRAERRSARRAARRQQHHETREERRARHHERNQAAKQSILCLFRRIFGSNADGDDEKEKRAGNDSNHTTMAQEIAGFREAANVVSDIVAAEEGRRSRESLLSSCPSYSTEDESLPAYGVVADGFHYQPGSAASSVGSEGSSTDANDRLGYDK